MSDDVLIRGQVVEAHDPPDDNSETDGYSAVARGLAYLGLTVYLTGPLQAVLEAGSDLGSLDPSIAVYNMAIGLVFVATAGLVSLLTSRPVYRTIAAIRDRTAANSDAEAADPLDVEETGGDQVASDSEQGVDPLNVEADTDD